MDVEQEAGELPEIRSLTKAQRRVLGVLVEKAFTVPESYPLTLKSVTTGCNQKSNRDPVTNYSEDQVLQTLDELRELGLVAVVHTESGRTERYRHYVRKRFPFSEPQLALMTELLLRGRQQAGELRARASRMVPIASLTELREELEGLIETGYVRTTGPLERRGVEIDHTLSPESESSDFRAAAPVFNDDQAHHVPGGEELEQELKELRQDYQDLQNEVSELQQSVAALQEEVADLRHSLGG